MNHNECQQYTDPVSNRLRKLTEANRSLAEIESLEDLLPRLLDLAKEVTAAEASLISLYNPKSRQRKSNFSRAIEIIRKHKDDSVPVGLVKNALRDEGQDYIVTTLGEVMDHNNWVDMSTTILITTNDSRIWESEYGKRIITPRGYHRKYDY